MFIPQTSPMNWMLISSTLILMLSLTFQLVNNKKNKIPLSFNLKSKTSSWKW